MTIFHTYFNSLASLKTQEETSGDFGSWAAVPSPLTRHKDPSEAAPMTRKKAPIQQGVTPQGQPGIAFPCRKGLEKH